MGLRKYGVSQSACTLERIAQATHRSMEKAKSDPILPKARRAQMAQAWELGYGNAGWGLKPCGRLTLARQWRIRLGAASRVGPPDVGVYRYLTLTDALG
ncbi:hypothetical protein B9Z51_15850 [Limnohabitans sp. T6-5]|uniref:hypothetical protein n=1 Tax=Limnohabitans sp. T6-5 TaxID=1100724 RepID=UPI000D37D570|nr:hypothetical protein [Limnohabitans sp. T6-5]PUE06289.1 hypothetical protein B9Z51_15850 [Limnohabitans sp. T6-5]